MNDNEARLEAIKLAVNTYGDCAETYKFADKLANFLIYGTCPTEPQENKIRFEKINPERKD